MRKYDYTEWNQYFQDKEKENRTIRFKNYSKIFDTDILIGVPYLINVDKYREICGDKNTRLSDMTDILPRLKSWGS